MTTAFKQHLIVFHVDEAGRKHTQKDDETDKENQTEN